MLNVERTHIEAPCVGRTYAAESHTEFLALLHIEEEIVGGTLPQNLVVACTLCPGCGVGRVAGIHHHLFAITGTIGGVVDHHLAGFGSSKLGRNEPVVGLIARRIGIKHMRLRTASVELPGSTVAIGINHCPFLELVFGREVGLVDSLSARSRGEGQRGQSE